MGGTFQYKMAEGASGFIGSYGWTEYKNPAKGSFRGLHISDAYFVGVSGDIDTSHGTHSARRYEDIANQIISAKPEENQWPEKAEVHLPIGGKTKAVPWIKVPNRQLMIDAIINGLAIDETKPWSEEAQKKAAAFLQSHEFLEWQKGVGKRDWDEMQNSYECYA